MRGVLTLKKLVVVVEDSSFFAQELAETKKINNNPANRNGFFMRSFALFSKNHLYINVRISLNGRCREVKSMG
jgi:hypothetical protein